MCKTSLEDVSVERRGFRASTESLSLSQFFPMVIESRVNKTEIITKLIETYFPAENDERRQLYEQDNMQR